MDVSALITKVSVQIVDPILLLLFVIAMLLFVWGIVQLIWGADNDEARATGKRHLWWGTVGVFIMTSAYAIVQLIKNTVESLK